MVNIKELPLSMKETNEQATGNKVAEVAKEKKVSISYTLKSLGENVKKLRIKGYITNEDARNILEVRSRAVAKYWKETFGE